MFIYDQALMLKNGNLCSGHSAAQFSWVWYFVFLVLEGNKRKLIGDHKSCSEPCYRCWLWIWRLTVTGGCMLFCVKREIKLDFLVAYTWWEPNPIQSVELLLLFWHWVKIGIISVIHRDLTFQRSASVDLFHCSILTSCLPLEVSVRLWPLCSKMFSSPVCGWRCVSVCTCCRREENKSPAVVLISSSFVSALRDQLSAGGFLCSFTFYQR